MSVFRIVLATMLVALVAYTAVTIANHGWDLLSVFFGDIARMGWPGQFNLDFTFMLTLSALWVAWRNRFTPAGLALSILALFGGALFLCSYLLVLSWTTGGNTRAMLTGDTA